MGLPDRIKRGRQQRRLMGKELDNIQTDGFKNKMQIIW